MVEPILEAGQDVQLHLHPCWHNVARGQVDGGVFELNAFEAEEQLDLIRAARDLLVQAGATEPIAFRAGGYAADSRTIGALRALGFAYDSSHNGCEHPDPSALPLAPSQIAPVELDGVVEIPVGQIEDSAGRLRHLQLCALSTEEMKAALLHASAEHHPVVTIVTHSFELATRGGERPNLTVCRRFERLCAFLAERRDELPTAWFSDLAGVPLGRAARPLPRRVVRTARRLVEQAWSNTVYERAF
jgi:hypothetical protein